MHTSFLSSRTSAQPHAAADLRTPTGKEPRGRGKWPRSGTHVSARAHTPPGTLLSPDQDEVAVAHQNDNHFSHIAYFLKGAATTSLCARSSVGVQTNEHRKLNPFGSLRRGRRRAARRFTHSYGLSTIQQNLAPYMDFIFLGFEIFNIQACNQVWWYRVWC
jgi:hypothetical protein